MHGYGWNGSHYHLPTPPGYDLATELRLRQQHTEARMDKLEDRVSKLERPRPRRDTFKEWSPVILPIVVLIAALLGKLQWPEAFKLIRALAGAGS